MASKEKNGDEKEVPILVYQCAKCLSILGDSLLKKESNDELGVVGLTKISPDVVVKADPNLGHRGSDEGCTYRMLQCKCEQLIGKIYLKTPKKLQNLVNLYCLKQNQILTYKVGMAQMVNVKDQDKDDSIKESFAKVEKMIMIFHARLKNIEDSFDTTESISTRQSMEKNETIPMPILKPEINKKTNTVTKRRVIRASETSSSSD